MRRFKKVYIEITNICNLECDFCIQNRRIAEHMSLERFQRIIDEVKGYTDHVYFHLLGEPLLSPRLDAFLGYAGEAALKVNLTTNGTLVRSRREILLASPALRKVSFSLHSHEANAQRIPFETYLSDILGFVKEASGKGIICELRLWNLDGGAVKGRHEENGRILDFITSFLEVPGIEGARGKEPGKGGMKLMENVYLGFGEKFSWPELSVLKEEAGAAFCYGLRDQIGILVDGTVVPCCLDSQGTIALGNIHEHPLQVILESERAKRIHRGFSERRPSEALCRSCSYARRFGG